MEGTAFPPSRLIINTGKTLPLGFHHKLNKHILCPNVVLNDRQIIHASKTKFLRVWLDQNLSWDFHVENVIIKLSKMFCTQNSQITIKTMYFAYFHSLLKYGILF
jgi:hypothetical protein